MVVNDFVDPFSKARLVRDRDGNLSMPDTNQIVFRPVHGVYDFTSRTSLKEEQSFYNERYSAKTLPQLTRAACEAQWSVSRFRENRVLLESLGNLNGKTILLLGNGTSCKEFHFLTMGARLVYTDISPSAVHVMREAFHTSEFAAEGLDKIDFHAVDASHLPYPDHFFDIIYGYAFVHHLSNLDAFFFEINRCLKKGGVCRFLDDAYSPLWEFLKKGPLAPLRQYSHQKTGISPEDLRASERGGFKQEELEEIQLKFGFHSLFSARTSFFQYMLTRFSAKFMGDGVVLKILLPIARMFDYLFIEKGGCLRKHAVRLIWGFGK